MSPTNSLLPTLCLTACLASPLQVRSANPEEAKTSTEHLTPTYSQLVNTAHDLVEHGELKEGVLAALAAIKCDDHRFEAYVVPALALMKDAEPAEAQYFLSEAMKRAPDSKKTALIELQELVRKQARAACLETVRLGAEHFKTNDFTGALNLARHAAHLDINQYEPRTLLALSLHGLGRDSEAEAEALHAVQLAPANVKPNLEKTLKPILQGVGSPANPGLDAIQDRFLPQTTDARSQIYREADCSTAWQNHYRL